MLSEVTKPTEIGVAKAVYYASVAVKENTGRSPKIHAISSQWLRQPISCENIISIHGSCERIKQTHGLPVVCYFNSLRPRDAYMRHQTRPSFIQIMAFRLLGTKPSSKPMLDYSQLGPCEHISVTF